MIMGKLTDLSKEKQQELAMDKLKEGDKLCVASGHIPFIDGRKFMKAWKNSKARIVKMRTDGTYFKSIKISKEKYRIRQLDKYSATGECIIKEDSAFRFRYRPEFVAKGNGSLDIVEILSALDKPKKLRKIDGKDVRISPSTLNIISMTIEVNGKEYTFKGKIPKGLLLEQAKEMRTTGYNSKYAKVLNLDGVHKLNELMELSKHLPKGIFFYRYCAPYMDTSISEGYVCKKIWNDGKEVMGGE